MTLRLPALTLVVLMSCGLALAQLPGDPPWRAGAEKFTVEDGVIYADGVPFLLNYDFTWSADKDEKLYEFGEDWGNTTTYGPVSVNVLSPFDFAEMDSIYDAAAAGHNYYTWCGGVAHEGRYLREHPEAARLGPGGEPVKRSAVCFLNPGYREALGTRLAEVAQSLAGRPFQLGYYPQDEFAFREWGCHCPVCKAEFRRRIEDKYETVAALNEAWDTELADFDAIEPPTKREASPRFCDWQEFRRWTQLDFAKFVYDTLKENDPNHLVIWSLPFWGGVNTTAAWWDFADVSDVLMRHGIGYRSGSYRIHLLRDVAEWSGKPGSALCMPPDYYPGFIRMMLVIDCPRTGLSQVCIAGEPHPTYQGVADPTHDWARREPGFTVSRSVNNIMFQLGDIYLLSKQRAPQLGLYVSDRTVLVNGTDRRDLNGLLQLLVDLNVDFQIFSEYNLEQLENYPAVMVASCSRCVSDEIAGQFERYVAGGGDLIMFDGAFAADWFNREAGNPGFGFAEVIGSSERERGKQTAAVTLGSDTLAGLPAEAPGSGEVSFRTPAEGCEVIGVMGEGDPVVTLARHGEGRVLYVGLQVGSVYNASWQEGFRQVLTTDDRAAALDDNAYGYDYRPPEGEALAPAAGYKAWAELVRSFLRSCGVTDNVEVAGYTDGIGVVRAKSFRQGDNYWVGIANRLTNPDLAFREVHEREFHQTLTDVTVRVRLDEDTTPEIAWAPPMTTHGEGTRSAMPALVPLRIVERGGERWAEFTLPEVVYGAVIALMKRGERPVVAGISLTPTRVAPASTVQVTGLVINTSDAAIIGTIEPGLEEGLVYKGEPESFRLDPGARHVAHLEVTVPEGTSGDYYQMNMVVTLDGGGQVFSPPVELHVDRDVIVEVAREQTIFPLGHLPPTVSATVTVNTQDPSDLTATVEVPEGFTVEPASIKLDPLEDAQSQTIEFSFGAPDATPRMAEGTLIISGMLRGKPWEWRHTVRLACGTVIYYKDEEYKTHASMTPTAMPLLCLENSHVLTTIIESNGIVHDLVLRDTNMDHLVPSPYPFGWVWYGYSGGWTRDEMSECGDEVWMRLKGSSPDGKPVTMTFSLGPEDDYLKIAIETNGAGPIGKPFYLMSRIGSDGRQQSLLWPTADGIKSLLWRKGTRTVPAADLTESWLAMHDDLTDQTFGCVYSFPSLDRVNLAPGQSGYNYMIFYPNNGGRQRRTVLATGRSRGASEICG
jgi:hypothetical protein